MRLRAGRALRGNYEEQGGPSGDRSVRFVADPSGRFALWCEAVDTEARCDGTTVWAIEDGAATFIARVPREARAVFGLVPPPIAEMLHPESAYIDAAFADPSTKDEELDMGQVRITGSESSIVYDRSIDIIHEYVRPDGLHRQLSGIELVEPTPGAYRWDGPVAQERGGEALVTTVVPITSLRAGADEASFAAHVEYRTDVLTYWLDGPGSGTGGAPVDDCVAWGLEHADRVVITVDLPDGRTRRFVAGDPDAPAAEQWEQARGQAEPA